jgi:hypothetical protein
MGYVKVADGDPPQEVEVKNELTVTEVAAWAVPASTHISRAKTTLEFMIRD